MLLNSKIRNQFLKRVGMCAAVMTSMATPQAIQSAPLLANQPTQSRADQTTQARADQRTQARPDQPIAKRKDFTDTVKGSVQVICKPATVTYEESKSESTVYDKFLKEDAHTSWFFHCVCDCSYEVKKVVEEKDSCSATIVITGVRALLSLPIKVRQIKDATPRLTLHEQGHVEICKKIYVGAKPVAQAACMELLGKTFTGSGESRDAALKNAVLIAIGEVGSKYQTSVAERAQTVSNIYDSVELKNNHSPSSESVTRAFAVLQEHELHSGPSPH